MCKTGHWMSISLLSSKCLLILFLCSCTLKLSLLFHMKMEVFRQIFGEQTKCTDVIRTKMHVYRLGAQNTYRRFILNFSICSTNQYNYLCSFTKNKRKKREIFIYCLTHSAKMFNDIVVSGERGKSSCLQTNMRMLFSAAPRSDIWGKVFTVSLWVSRGSRVSCFVLRCEINEKPFDFPSKESVHVGRNCELCRRERRHPLVERGNKRGGGDALIKQFLLIITQFGVSIFILH